MEDTTSTPGRTVTRIKKTIPFSVAAMAGVPPNCAVVAINGKSMEFRRSFKEVKKKLQIAQRPVTVAFSQEDEITWPKRVPKLPKPQLPAYALRPA